MHRRVFACIGMHFCIAMFCTSSVESLKLYLELLPLHFACQQSFNSSCWKTPIGQMIKTAVTFGSERSSY